MKMKLGRAFADSAARISGASASRPATAPTIFRQLCRFIIVRIPFNSSNNRAKKRLGHESLPCSILPSRDSKCQSLVEFRIFSDGRRDQALMRRMTSRLSARAAVDGLDTLVRFLQRSVMFAFRLQVAQNFEKGRR